jgi:hypothetical protein
MTAIATASQGNPRMAHARVEVLTAARLPELWRKVCAHAGVMLTQVPVGPSRFVVRSGGESPELLAKLLEEALAEDGAEVVAIPGDDALADSVPTSGRVQVRGGYPFPCPLDAELRGVAELGDVIIFAVERWDAAGRLAQVTWAGMPDELPASEAPLAASVMTQTLADNGPADGRTSPAPAC